MMNKAIIGIFMMAFVLSGCGEQTVQQPAEVPEQRAAEMPQKEIPAQAEVKEFAVEAFQYSFEPDVIEVDTGDRVKITLTTRDVGHGFAIKEYNINQGVQPGETKTIEFVADKAGTFTFYCSVYCGSGHKGMKGQLVVK